MTWSTVLAAAGYWDGGDLLRVPTSGTTGGAARTVLRTVGSWTDSFAPFTEATGTTADDVIVAAGPPTSLFVYARAHAAALGARTVDAPRWDPRLLAGATVAHLTPTMLGDALADGVRAEWESSLRLVVVAGAALSPRLRDRALKRGLDAVEYYGAAELSFVALGRGRLTPFSGVEVECRDGEIWVRSPWTALGYADGAKGPLRVAGEWCTVGDRGSLVDGAVVVHGRDGVVLTGGASVLTADVETVLRSAPGVVDCTVLGLPHHRLGEVMAAVVVGGVRSEVVAHCRAALAREQRPVRWFAVDRIPSTTAGKVSLPELRRAITAGEVHRWL
ncbi:MAG: AMP-binding protein [Dermatophilaceae bacterium]